MNCGDNAGNLGLHLSSPDQANELSVVVLPSNGAVGCRGVSGSAAPGRSSLRRAASSRMLP